MAAKRPASMPLLAQARATLNSFARMEDGVIRSLAALSTYANEGDAKHIQSETRYLRGRLEGELSHMKSLVTGMLHHIQHHDMDNNDLNDKVTKLSAKVKSLQDEELSFTQAMDAMDSDDVIDSSQEVSAASQEAPAESAAEKHSAAEEEENKL